MIYIEGKPHFFNDMIDNGIHEVTEEKINEKGEKVKVLKKIHRYTLVKKVPTAVIHRKETWKKFGKALEKDNEKCTFLSEHEVFMEPPESFSENQKSEPLLLEKGLEIKCSKCNEKHWSRICPEKEKEKSKNSTPDKYSKSKETFEKPDKKYSILPTVMHLLGNLKGKTVLDLGCGFGYTCAGLKSIFPNATVIGTNLPETAQYKMANDLSKDFNFIMKGHAGGIKTDLVFASEYFEHIIDPISHLHYIIKECSPKMLLIANTFNSPAIGHFKLYEYKGIKYSGPKMSRMFNDALRYYGYQKVKTNCWNARPAYWKKVI